MKSIYIVGTNIKGKQWEVQGVYTDEATAVKACKGWCWFVMPIEVNTPLPDEPVETGYYPMNEAVRIGININTSNSEGFVLTEKQVGSIVDFVNDKEG